MTVRYRNLCSFCVRPIGIFLLTSLLFVALSDPICAQGIQFVGGDHPIEERTSMVLFAEGAPKLQSEFEIRFDLQLPSNGTVGYIMRVNDHHHGPTFNLYYDEEDGQTVFRFNEEGKTNLITLHTRQEILQKRHWLPVRLRFDVEQGLIQLQIADIPTQVTQIPLNSDYSPQISFGKSDYLIDVPSMAIRELSVADQNRKIIFPLKETEGTKVHNTQGHAMGRVFNGIWLLNQAFYWKKHIQHTFDERAGSTYDPNTKSVYYFSRDSLWTYHLQNDQQNALAFRTPCPIPLKRANAFINPNDHRLYVYETYLDSLYTGPTVASVSLNDYSWRVESTDYLNRELHHHGAAFIPDKNRLLIFGGFGNMRYSDRFVYYRVDEGSWKQPDSVSGAAIFPRYFTSMGYAPQQQKIYLFGGMGNESGDHVVGRTYFYDFYRIDPHTGKSTKLWQLDWNQTAFVPARGLIVADTSWVYLLGYPEHLTHSYMQLRRFSLNNGHHQQLGDSIPIYSDKISTHAQLFYDEHLKKLITVVQESDDDIRSTVSIYSLDFPPIPQEELHAFPASAAQSGNWWLWTILAVCGSGLLYILSRHFPKLTLRRQNHKVSRPRDSSTSQPSSIIKNRIRLFGEFSVIDKHGRDISHLFSARLKQVLCLMLFHKDAAGISSNLLSHLLWPDKPKDKAKTSRGVAINNLRKSISDIDGLEIIYEAGHYRLIYPSEDCCDYKEFKRHIVRSDEEKSSTVVREILQQGEFLLGLDDPLFDKVKAEVEASSIAFLSESIRLHKIRRNWPAVLSDAEILLRVDPINDFAIKQILFALAKEREKTRAKIVYQQFLDKYQLITGQTYESSFDELWRANS